MIRELPLKILPFMADPAHFRAAVLFSSKQDFVFHTEELPQFHPDETALDPLEEFMPESDFAFPVDDK